MKEPILGLIRHALTTLGGIFAAKGTIGENEVEVVAGAIVVLVGFVWSLISKKKPAEVTE